MAPADGPRDSRELREEAASQGISQDALYHARRNLQLIEQRQAAKDRPQRSLWMTA